jgi:anaerobic magnesium-protoporphyrin IX monomethyl ester cyclase
MTIVLARPKYSSHIITPPLGLGYLASYLKKKGIDAVLIDGLKENLEPGELVEKICSYKPDAVGITCLTTFYSEATDLSRRLKERGIKCIMGGPHPTFLPYQTLIDSKADYAVCGEGEIALSCLAKNGYVNNGIRGVYSLENLKNASQQVEKAEIVENLDSLPFPDWEQMDPRTYPKAPHGALAKRFPVGVLMTTRGCPYECVFCASPGLYDRRIRFRSPENVLEEMELLTRDYGVREIHFEDDNLTLKREHAEKICRLIKEKKLDITWACPNGIRADKVDEELIGLMAESGCYYFAYGIESANPGILKKIRKNETIGDIEKAITIAHKKGISCQGFFIFGLPGESKETIRESIDFAKRAKLSRAQFCVLDILPGSELWNSLQGKFTPQWNKESFLEPEWIPESLTRQDLVSAQKRAFYEFYLRPGTLYGMLRLVNREQIRFLAKRIRAYARL